MKVKERNETQVLAIRQIHGHKDHFTYQLHECPQGTQ